MLKVIGGAQEGEFKAVASGTLPNGKPVVVNADGTVSVAAETSVSQAVGTPTTFQSGNTEATSAAYDTNAQRVVVAYKDDTASNGKAVVGTVSGTSISFGTPVVFESGITDYTSTVYDSSAQKIVIAYRDSSDSDGKVIVGTVSGTSISFGTAVEFTADTPTFVATVYDSNAEKVIIAYSDGNASNAGKAIVGTVSGTSISLGSAAVFESGSTMDTSIAYDSNAQKVVLSYRDHSNSGHGTSIVGTVSGTSISFGSAVVFESANTDFTATVYDSNAQKIVVFYEDEDNSNYGTAIVGTVSGTSISFGTPVVFESAETQEISASYDVNAQKVVVAYKDGGNSNKGTIAVGTVSGTSISFNTPAEFEAGGTYKITTTYDSDAQKVVIAYRDNNDSLNGKAAVFQTAYTSANLTSENYIGMSRGVVDVESVAQAIGSPVVFQSANAILSSATFDSSSNKVVIAYRNGVTNYGTAIVGTVSGTSISFGSPVVFEAAVTSYISATFDSSNNKVVVAYEDGGNSNYGTAIVGTVSGTSISFGSAAVFYSGSAYDVSATFDSSNNKVVIAFGNASFYGTAIVGTVSGTSISFGSAVVFRNADLTNDPNIFATFDSSNNKVVITYKDGNTGPGTAIVGTVSGTSISFGSPVVFNSAASYYNVSTFDSSNNKVVITYQDSGNSNYGTAIVGTVSGTSISFGSAVVFEAATSSFMHPIFDSNSNKVAIAYRDSGNSNYGTVIVGTVSDTSISFGSPAVFENGNSFYISATFDSSNNKVVIAYTDISNSYYGTSVVFQPEFTNITRGQVPSGSQAITNIIGSVSSIQTGLTAGQQYFVQTDGTIGTTADSPSVLAGTAISATELLVKT